jgi:hypothetical protein
MMALNISTIPDALIPDGTICAVILVLVPGYGTQIPDATMSKTSDALMAVFKATVYWPEQYSGRVLWDRPGLRGKSVNGAPAAEGNFYEFEGMQRMRSYVESAKGLAHDDLSSEAVTLRNSYTMLNQWHGLKVLVVTKHEPDNRGNKRAIIGNVLTASNYPQYQDNARAAGIGNEDPAFSDDIPQ